MIRSSGIRDIEWESLRVGEFGNEKIKLDSCGMTKCMGK